MSASTKTIVLIAIGLLVLLLLIDAVFVVSETNQVIITQFGEPIGGPINTAGLHLKAPFIQKTNYFEKRWLEWDGDPNQIPTRDKKYIWMDTYARWRISDPLVFFQRGRDSPDHPGECLQDHPAIRGGAQGCPGQEDQLCG